MAVREGEGRGVADVERVPTICVFDSDGDKEDDALIQPVTVEKGWEAETDEEPLTEGKGEEEEDSVSATVAVELLVRVGATEKLHFVCEGKFEEVIVKEVKGDVEGRVLPLCVAVPPDTLFEVREVSEGSVVPVKI